MQRNSKQFQKNQHKAKVFNISKTIEVLTKATEEAQGDTNWKGKNQNIFFANDSLYGPKNQS